MSALDHRPQYRQIESALRRRIASLQPGARLPSDSQLRTEFGVSRMTARNAMQLLAEDGLIERQPGRGSFVTEAPARRHANRLMTFTDEMIRTGRSPSSRVLDRRIRPSTADESADLGIPPHQPVVHLRRLRLADGLPVALESTVLLGSYARPVMEADLSHAIAARDPSSRGDRAAPRHRDDRGRRGQRGGCPAAGDPNRGPAAGRASRDRRRPRSLDRGDRVTIPRRPLWPGRQV